VYGDVVGFVALNFVLRIIRAGMVRETLVVRVFLVYPEILPVTGPASEFQRT
jgi:hypothetical protein